MTQLQTSKIDSFAGVGPNTGEPASVVAAIVAIGPHTETLEVAKIDSFTSLVVAPIIGRQNSFTGQWIGPPKVPGT